MTEQAILEEANSQTTAAPQITDQKEETTKIRVVKDLTLVKANTDAAKVEPPV
jgi:hypothetical protein